jgi:hypothetical protein
MHGMCIHEGKKCRGVKHNVARSGVITSRDMTALMKIGAVRVGSFRGGPAKTPTSTVVGTTAAQWSGQRVNCWTVRPTRNN